MPPYLLIGLLTVLLIIVVYAVMKDAPWAHRAHWTAKSSTSAQELARRSDGTFDRAARAALDRALATPNPTPLDHLLAATVITNNILGQEHRPETTAGGRPTRRAMNQARQRRDMYATARDQFIAAVDGARQPARRVEVLAMPGNFATQLHRERLAVLNAATEFAFGGMDLLLANDPLVQLLVGEDWAVNPGQFDWGGAIAGMVDVPLATRTTALREELVQERQAAAAGAAAAHGGARGAAVETYVGLATQNTSDAQNVHDSGVLACLKAIVARLRDDQGDLARLPTADQIAADVRANGAALSRFNERSPARPERVEDVVAVIERTKAGERVVALGATDEECLRRVWQRADDPRNAANRGKLRQAVFDALLDAWEPDDPPFSSRHIACVNGRTGRLLGALNQLDFDPRNWEVKRLEQFKNEIFAKTRETIEAVASEAAASGPPDLQRAGRLYLAKTAADIAAIGAVPDAATEQLAERMRAAITAMVDRYVETMDREYGVKDAIPKFMLDSVKAEAIAAV
jgi:hypothetical protein